MEDSSGNVCIGKSCYNYASQYVNMASLKRNTRKYRPKRTNNYNLFTNKTGNYQFIKPRRTGGKTRRARK